MKHARGMVWGLVTAASRRLLCEFARLEPDPWIRQKKAPGTSPGARWLIGCVVLFADDDVVREQWIWKVREDRRKLLEDWPVGGGELLPLGRRLP